MPPIFNFNYVSRRFKILYTRGTIVRRTWYPRVDSKKISVVLLKDSKNLGKSGDIVETSRGYANYHLIPNGIAAYANWYNIDLYHKSEYDRSFDSKRELKHAKDSDLSVLDCDPVNILFSGRLANYVISFTVNTFGPEKINLVSPISLYKVLDEFSNKHNIDLVPSQVSEIRLIGSDQIFNILEGDDYMNFYLVGNYEITANLPLKNDNTNKLQFTLQIIPIDYGKHEDSDSMDFQLPETISSS